MGEKTSGYAVFHQAFVTIVGRERVEKIRDAFREQYVRGPWREHVVADNVVPHARIQWLKQGQPVPMEEIGAFATDFERVPMPFNPWLLVFVDRANPLPEEEKIKTFCDIPVYYYLAERPDWASSA